jgi:hypothetical protein
MSKGKSTQWEHALNPLDGLPVAGLPRAAWARVFEFHFAAPPAYGYTSPLRICKDLHILTMVTLYAHPRIGDSSIAGFEASLSLPSPVVLGATRAHLVRTLEVWPTVKRKRARDAEIPDFSTPEYTDSQEEEEERLRIQANPHAARLAERLKQRHRPVDPTAVQAVPMDRPTPPPPPPAASTIHPDLPALLGLLSLDHLALHDVYMPDAASARVLLSALNSTTPRTASLELRMWPAELTMLVQSQALPRTTEEAVVSSVLRKLVPRGEAVPSYKRDTPLPEVHEAQQQRAWLAAVMAGQRFDLTQFAQQEKYARAQHAMLLEWLAGLYAAKQGLDRGGRKQVRAKLDPDFLRDLELALADAGTEPPSNTYGPYTVAQTAARTQYAKYAKECLERANNAVQASLRRIHDAVEAGIQSPYTLAAGMEGDAPHFAPTTAELKELLEESGDGRLPLDAKEALRAVASAFAGSGYAEMKEAFPALGVGTAIEAFDATYPIFADRDSTPPPMVVPDELLAALGLPTIPSAKHDPTHWGFKHSKRLGTLKHQPNGGRPLAWLVNHIPIVPHTATPLLLDAESMTGVAYIFREQIGDILGAWGRGDLPKIDNRKKGNKKTNDPKQTNDPKKINRMHPLRPMTDPNFSVAQDKNLQSLFASTCLGALLEKQAEPAPQEPPPEEEKEAEKRVCSRLVITAADPQAAQVLCAADRSLWPKVGIEHITIQLPAAVPPLNALGEPNIEAHPGGKGLLHPSTKGFELRVRVGEWDDELWLAGYLPHQVERVLIGRNGAETLVEEEEEMSEDEDDNELDWEEICEDEVEDEEEWECDSDYIDVDDDELADDFDGTPGENFDPVFAAAQAARVAARRKEL